MFSVCLKNRVEAYFRDAGPQAERGTLSSHSQFNKHWQGSTPRLDPVGRTSRGPSIWYTPGGKFSQCVGFTLRINLGKITGENERPPCQLFITLLFEPASPLQTLLFYCQLSHPP